MVIVHIDFTGPFTEGMNYQENLLARCNVEDGNEVYFIAPCYKWSGNKIVYAPSGTTITIEGIKLIRLPYMHMMSVRIDNKIRVPVGLESTLEEISPNVIMLHCYQTFATHQVIKYLKKNLDVKLYVDNHADYHNSARNFFSRYILHGIYYSFFAREVLNYTKSILCITEEVARFTKEVNHISSQRLELFPLGGFVLQDKDYYRIRNERREKLGLTKEDIVLVHSGKMTKEKKTYEIVKALSRVNNKNIKLLIIGEMAPGVKENVEKIIKCDNRIHYLGWKSGEELQEYLCAGDMYLQPGTQSATLQNAACARCALCIYPHNSYTSIFGKAAYYAKTENEIEEVINQIGQDRNKLLEKQNEVFDIASQKLDYKKMASILYR